MTLNTVPDNAYDFHNFGLIHFKEYGSKIKKQHLNDSSTFDIIHGISVSWGIF